METMKNKLIDYKTGEETLCDKVTVDGYDYYVSDEKYIEDELLYCVANGWLQKARVEHLVEQRGNDNQWKKIIATTNPNIDDVPKVVDEVTEMAYNWLYDEETENKASQGYPLKPMEYGFIKGYTKSQETHPFSEEDMIEFAEWIANSKLHGYSKQLYEAMIRHKVSTTKELLQIWKEQKIKTLYYE